jgi:glucuronoarabinoxylan endo-1,4-beta-xylanase
MQALRFAAVTVLALATFVASPRVRAAEVKIDRAQRFQTIDGFGFFGAHDVWWGQAKDMANPAWFDLVIKDLGITIWRNEIHPPADAIAAQDADWPKQKPAVQGIWDAAKAAGVDLKVILSVWSPPSSMKCVADDNGVRDGQPHPGGTKNGGGLCPSKRSEFASYLVAAIKQYADIGVGVYALSFQNEPLFVEPYNSCVYTQKEYADTLAAIGPVIHAAYPNLKLFGSENMLAIECGGANGFDPYWYTANIMKSAAAVGQLGIWAVHGYSDGVLATPTSQMSKYWASFYSGTAGARLPTWMTETSGYVDTIESDGKLPGALDLAQAIYAGLVHGHMSAWVWWQGSQLGSSAPDEYGLMSSTTKRGKKYYVSKNFYRYIRPGAQMVAVSSDDPEVLVAAFDNGASKAFTLIAINGGKSSKTVTLTGINWSGDLQAYRTSASEDCADVGPVKPSAVTLPARSITTFVDGQVTLGPGSIDGGVAGSGGAPGSGGRSGADAARGTGGRAGSGGATGQGGGSGGTGGAATTGALTGAGGAEVGGAPGSGGESGGTAGAEKGCGCRLGAPASPRVAWPLALALLGWRAARGRR